MSDSVALFSRDALAAHEAWMSRDTAGVRIVAQGADFSQLRLDPQPLARARFVGCRFVETNWDGAMLEQAEFEACDFTRGSLGGVALQEAVFTRCTLEGADLRRSEMNMVQVEGGSWRGATITDANLNGIQVSGSSWLQLGLDRTTLVKSEWCDTRLAGSCLDSADLREASFTRVDLRACDLDHAVLDHTWFDGCGVHGTVGDPNVIHALVSSVDFSPAFDGSDPGDRDRFVAALSSGR